MILECVLKTTDFIPIVKKPKFWMAPNTLSFGSQLTIDDEIGHQILAAYPGSFKVMQYGDAPKAETKVRRKDYDRKVVSHEEMASKELSDNVGSMII